MGTGLPTLKATGVVSLYDFLSSCSHRSGGLINVTGIYDAGSLAVQPPRHQEPARDPHPGHERVVRHANGRHQPADASRSP